MTRKISSYLTMPSSSIMTSREHPFNQSQRPLLAERKPQFILKKNNNNIGSNKSSLPSALTATTASTTAQADYNTKLHGFNDFDDIMSKQYQNLNSHNIGYPYGSPPSPTSICNAQDFVFNDDKMNSSKIKPCPQSATDDDENHYSYVIEDFYNKNDNGNVINSCNNRKFFQSNKNNKFNNNWSNNQKQFTSYNNIDGNTTNGPFIFGIHNENHFISSNLDTTTTNIESYNSSTVINSKKGFFNFKRNNNTNKNKPLAFNQSNSDSSSSSKDYEKESKFLVKCRKKSSKINKTDKTKYNNNNNNNKDIQPKIKCVVVGDGAVGKTNLIKSYLENRFITEHIPTASDIYNAEVMVNDSPVHITLCDTAGQDTLDPLRELSYPDSDVFLLCFSVVKPDTFKSIKNKWAPKFSKSKAALILVGTQIDLRNDINILNKLQLQKENMISSSDAWDLATSIGAKYIETSSITQENVKDVFDAAIWEALLPTHTPCEPPLWKRWLCLV